MLCFAVMEVNVLYYPSSTQNFLLVNTTMKYEGGTCGQLIGVQVTSTDDGTHAVEESEVVDCFL